MTNVVQTVVGLNSATLNSIENAFALIAEKLGVGVDYFWPIFVKQQFISGISAISVIAFLFLITILSYRIFKYFYIKNGCVLTVGDCPNISLVFFILTSALLIISIGICLGDIENIITSICNPEYKAVTEIIKLIK